MVFDFEVEIEIAKNKAIDVLKHCSTRNGLYASCGFEPYTQVWARDSMISMIGACFVTSDLKSTFEKSLITLAENQSELGQIPNAVDFVGSIDKPATFATIDSSLWFVLGEYFYKKKFGSYLWRKHKKNIDKAMLWVAYQDSGEDLLPEQLPTCDWQDCFPHKYGHTINTQSLYYGALKVIGKNSFLKKFRKAVNYYLWSDDLGYFLPWHWKDHGVHKELETWFDSLGNLLAIVFGLANKKQAKSILDFIMSNNIHKPYPVKVLYPPIKRNSKEWHDYFEACLAAEPNNYLNGGVWPFVGGFYVAALVEAKKFDEAFESLVKLVEANKLSKRKNFKWDFNEWIHPITKKASGGRWQSWSAGSYLLAYHAVKTKSNPLNNIK